jgi:hypothetical protein
MTPAEKELLLRQYTQGTSGKAMLGNALDMGGAALGYADGLVTPAARQAQLSILNRLGGVGSGAGGFGSRMAGAMLTPGALTALKIGTGVSAVGGVLGAADLVLGDESIGNKAMDLTAMGIGGFLGAAGGPVGVAAGAGVGKALSDGTQWLFGDKKSPEERRMEEALAMLQGRGMY